MTGVFTPTRVTMPQQIAGITRLDSESVQRFEARLRAYAGEHGVAAEAGIYGDGLPSFMVVVVDGNPSDGPSATFREFATGFARSAGNRASVDTSAATRTTEDGAAFECAPGRGKLHGAICQWADGRTVGYVMSLNDRVDDTMDLSVVVRNAVES
jgi:hypothetical protein